MTTLARKIIATPARAASEAWEVIVNLLAPQKDSTAHKNLDAITGVVSSLIADEAVKEAPIVVHGSGPRLHIYCLYDEEAIVGDRASEAALPFNPTEGNWQISFPCPIDDLSWVQASLNKVSNQITARDLTTTVSENQDQKETTVTNKEVNLEAFLRL